MPTAQWEDRKFHSRHQNPGRPEGIFSLSGCQLSLESQNELEDYLIPQFAHEEAKRVHGG